ncbi:MAG TPA: selenoneine synthase SenA [Myxococcales bacterium]|nr:selenoneine synthase SenA [Myxococcales bacterium]
MDELIQPLRDARAVELAILDSLAESQLMGEQAHFLEPPIWEIGHVGWFQEYWLLRHLDAAEPLLAGSDKIYDSFNVSYRLRWEHAYPSRQQTLEYVSDVLARSIDRLKKPSALDKYFYTLAALHEDMHAENLMLVLATLGYARPELPLFEKTAPAVDERWKPGDVEVPGGMFMLGASKSEPFVFDNEKWAHPVEVRPFRISTAPVTNGEFSEFVKDSGYTRREPWSARGWDWRRRAGITQPIFWTPDGLVRNFDKLETPHPWHPVCGVSWFEAEAYCKWANRRLPTEAEWEMAASLDPKTGEKRRYPWGDSPPEAAHANLDYRAGGTVDVRALPAGDSAFGCRQMIGNVWEWVSDTFEPYPGFICDPYKEYSEPYFGTKKVLRGGCWTTRGRLIRNTWRNFFMKQRRNLFAGFRTCAI